MNARSVTVLCAAAALACGGTETPKPRASTPNIPMTQAPPPPGRASPAAISLEDRIDLIVEPCLNSFAARAYESRDRYLSWVDKNTGPTGKERNVYGLYELSTPLVRCREAVGQLQATEPRDPELDAAAKAWIDTLTILSQQIGDAAPYYELNRYQDDNFGRGRAMHAPLMTAFDTFIAADHALVPLVEARIDRLDDAATDRLSNQPPSTEAVLRRMIRSARGTMATLSRVHETPAGQIEGPLPEIETRMRDLAAATDALARWERERLAPDVDGLDRIVDAGRALEGAMRNVAHLVRSREPLSDTNAAWCGTSSGWMVEGCPDKVIEAYEDFVDAVNMDDRVRPHLIRPARGR